MGLTVRVPGHRNRRGQNPRRKGCRGDPLTMPDQPWLRDRLDQDRQDYTVYTGSLSYKEALALIFKLAEAAEQSWGPQPIAGSYLRCRVCQRNRTRPQGQAAPPVVSVANIGR
jgi:hypothetical protein